jgi:HSP20 family protein
MARALQPWIHCRLLEDFRREIDDIFSRSFRGAGPQVSLAPAFPPIESFLDGNEYVIRLHLPGIDLKEIKVTVSGDVVTVRGTREDHDKQESWNVIHCELTQGDFERKVTLPQGIRTDDIKAAYNHGVLELRMPAPKEAPGRKIPIQVETTKVKNS